MQRGVMGAREVFTNQRDTGDDRVGHSVVGKRTLTEALPPAPASSAQPVQRRSAGVTPATGPEAVHAAAAHGTSGASAPLPHLSRIQALFGRHDISGIQAHHGPEASTATRAMGAEAFATGHHVAFDGAPSLHTAAHEAAHVVQQRAGVHLAGGVGRDGDVYEQHADAVADAIVQGKSAEALLDVHAPGSGGAGHAADIQAKLTRGSGWSWMVVSWVDDKAEGIWNDIDLRFNTQLPSLIMSVEQLSKKELKAARTAPGVLSKLKDLFTKYDEKTIDYSKAKTLQDELDKTLKSANELLEAAREEEEALEKQRKEEEAQRKREEEAQRKQLTDERTNELGAFKTRIGDKITNLPFLQSDKPPIDERREIAKEITELLKDARPWNSGEKRSFENRIRQLEKAYKEAHQKWLKDKARRTIESEPQDQEQAVELSERAQAHKKQAGSAFNNLSRACDGDTKTINAIVAKIAVGDLGRVSNSLMYVTTKQWLELSDIPDVTADIINQLLTQTGGDRFADAKAMLNATTQFAALIELVTLYDGDEGNKIVPALKRPSADARKVVQLAKQSASEALLEHLAADTVAHTDVATLLTGSSKNDAAFLIEKLADSALLVKLVATVADALETRLLVEDLSRIPAALAAVKERYNQQPPPNKAQLYGLAPVKTARGLKTRAGADIGTAKLSDLNGTKEQAGVKATVAHVRGGEKPKLTHAAGAKFGDTFNNDAGRLPGVAGAGGYKEYYVEKDPTSVEFHGDRRVVVSDATDHIYYTSDHYASFRRLLT